MVRGRFQEEGNCIATMKNLKDISRMRKLRRTLPIVLALTLVHAITTVNGYGGGAPEGVCGTMIPGHGQSPQTGPNPYKIVLSKTAVKGQEVMDITITSNSGNDEFLGYLVQVRKPGEDRKAFGVFNEVVENELGQTLKCFDSEHSAVTHTSNKPKKSVTLQWTAPNEEDAEYEVLFSVLKSFGEYWTHQPHEQKIRVTRDVTATTTAAPVLAASADLVKKWREAYQGCGDTKGCFGMPGKCVQNFDESSDNPSVCKIMVTWAKKGGVNEFELTGNLGSAQNGYVAVGFSEDDKMGKDSVVGCGFRGSGSEPTILRYHNPGGYSPNEKNTPANLGITEMAKSNTEGNLFCKFTQINHEIADVKIDFDKPHYLLLSTANSIGDDYLGKHGNDDKGASPQSIVITDNIIMGADSNNWLVQLHGGLMVIAWLLCASTGMFVARYYKQTHVEVMPCAKAFWFSLHVFCMASTAFLTICGSIVILIKKKGLYLQDVHPILGVIVVGLAICQVFIAFLRPHPNTPMRPFFNWIHWGIGNSAHIVGITCIGFAVDLGLADLKRFGDENLWVWILLGLVLFHVSMHIIMSIHTLWSDKQMSEGKNKKRAMVPGPMKPSGGSSEAPGTVFRDFMLGLYLLIMAAGAIALVALVFWPKKKEGDPTA